jgi:hypothetical protein
MLLPFLTVRSLTTTITAATSSLSLSLSVLTNCMQFRGQMSHAEDLHEAVWF